MADKRPEYPSEADLEHWFTHHPPEDNEIWKYEELRNQAKIFARTILHMCPAGADRTAAIRKVREAVMTANAAIACKGR